MLQLQTEYKPYLFIFSFTYPAVFLKGSCDPDGSPKTGFLCTMQTRLGLKDNEQLDDCELKCNRKAERGNLSGSFPVKITPHDNVSGQQLIIRNPSHPCFHRLTIDESRWLRTWLFSDACKCNKEKLDWEELLCFFSDFIVVMSAWFTCMDSSVVPSEVHWLVFLCLWLLFVIRM